MKKLVFLATVLLVFFLGCQGLQQGPPEGIQFRPPVPPPPVPQPPAGGVNVILTGPRDDLVVMVRPWRVAVSKQSHTALSVHLRGPVQLVQSFEINNTSTDDCPECKDKLGYSTQNQMKPKPVVPDNSGQATLIYNVTGVPDTGEGVWWGYNIVLTMDNGEKVIIDPDYRVYP